MNTDEIEEAREPHDPEAVAVEGSYQVSVDNPPLESSEHVVEVEVLVGRRPGMNDAALSEFTTTLS